MTTDRPIDAWRRGANSMGRSLREIIQPRLVQPRRGLRRALASYRTAWWGRLLPLVLLSIIFACDRLLDSGSAPLILHGLVDEVAHLLTSVVVLGGLAAAGVRLTRPVWVSALAASVLIDIDHLPAVLGGQWQLAADRPVTHSIWLIPLALIAGLVLRRRFGTKAVLVAQGIGIGIATHLMRDATGAGTRLLLPVSDVPIVLPYPLYAGALVLAALAWVLRPNGSREGLTPTASRVITAAATLGYALHVTAGMWGRLDAFRLAGYDTGIFAQGVWLLAHGENPFVTVRGLGLFADHASYILLVIAPLYQMWPSPRLLLLLQAVGVAAPALVLNALLLRDKRVWAAVVFPLVYLLYPAQQWGGTFEWHPESLAPALLLLGAMWGMHSRHRLWWWPLGLAVLCKEDVSLMVVGIGLMLLSFGRVRRGAATIGAGLGYFLIVTALVMPVMGGSRNSFYYRKNYGLDTGDESFGWVAGLPTIIRQVFEHAQTDSGLGYLSLILLPVAGLALFAPRWLLPTAAPLVLNLAAVIPELQSIKFHYLLTSAPFIVAAAAMGSGWLVAALRHRSPAGEWLRARWEPVVLLAVLSVALVFSAERGAMPKLAEDPKVTSPATIAAGQRALEMIPDRRVVAASWNLVSLVADRTQVYELPVPYGQGWWGAGKPTAEMRASVEYVIAQPSQLRKMDVEAWRRLRADPAWTVMLEQDDIVLLKRAVR